MKPETIAQYYLSAPAYEVPSDIAKDFQQFIIDLAQVELQDVRCHYVDFQPYLIGTELSREAMQADVNSGNLLISNQFNESELLGSEINLIFRSIHDLHHVKLDVDFSWEGECASARYIMSLTDNILFKQLLFSEILGQSSVCLSTGTFPEDQKIVLFERDILQNLSQI